MIDAWGQWMLLTLEEIGVLDQLGHPRADHGLGHLLRLSVPEKNRPHPVELALDRLDVVDQLLWFVAELGLFFLRVDLGLFESFRQGGKPDALESASAMSSFFKPTRLVT